jgi:hypothetical protein
MRIGMAVCFYKSWNYFLDSRSHVVDVVVKSLNGMLMVLISTLYCDVIQW